jgi:hypothetical protein
VETAGLSLDEIDRVFVLKHAEGSGLTYKQATIKAKDELAAERMEIQRRESTAGNEKQGSNHIEEVA